MKRENIGRGKLQTSSGLAVFHISFHALMLRPFKNEVLVAVAKECTRSEGVGLGDYYTKLPHVPHQQTELLCVQSPQPDEVSCKFKT